MKKKLGILLVLSAFILLPSSFAQEETEESWVYGKKVYERIIDNSNGIDQIKGKIDDIEDDIKEGLKVAEVDNANNKEDILAINGKMNEVLSIIKGNEKQIKYLSEKSSLTEQDLRKIGELLEQEAVRSKATDSDVIDKLSLMDKAVSGLNTIASKTIDSTKNDFGKMKRLLAAILAGIIFIVSVLAVYIWKKIHKMKISFEDKISKLGNEYNEKLLSVDVRIIDGFKNMLDALNNVKEPGESNGGHDLPIKVAEEINRMKTRISSMPEETVGLKAISKALERLEEKLSELGYSIVDLLGKPYEDGLTVQARFVVVDSLRKEERIITKVLKPQINYKGTLIQSAEVEVNCGQ